MYVYINVFSDMFAPFSPIATSLAHSLSLPVSISYHVMHVGRGWLHFASVAVVFIQYNESFSGSNTVLARVSLF